MEALGSILGDAALAIVDKVQCPEAIAGQSVLAAATLAVQGHADIELPQGSTAPLSSFFLTVAHSGERKSTADRKSALADPSAGEDPARAVRRRHARLHDQAGVVGSVTQTDPQQQEAVPRGQARRARGARPGAGAASHAAPDLPEPTFEGLCLLLQGGHPSVGVFSAEGGQFLGGYGMSKDHRLKTAAALSGVWDGEPIRRVRRGDGVVLLPGRRVAMHLLVQPGVSNLLLGSHELNDQGLVSRVLASAPATTAGSRFWRDPRPESDRAIRRYGARILQILEHALPLERDKRNELAPRTLRLASSARQRLIDFMDHVERQLGPKGPLGPIRAFANKVPEHAARLGKRAGSGRATRCR